MSKRRPANALQRSHYLLAMVLGLAAACGSSSHEKVDAGQRKYCDAYCADGGIQVADTAKGSGGSDGGGLAVDASADLPGGQAEVLRADAVASFVDALAIDGASTSLDSGEAVDGQHLDATGGSGGTGGAGGTGGGGSGGILGTDAPADLRRDGADGAMDSSDSPVDLLSDIVFLDQSTEVGDVPSDVGDTRFADASDAGPDIATDIPADLLSQPDGPTCQPAQVASQWQPQQWPDGFAGLAYTADGALWAAGRFSATFTVGSTTASSTSTSASASDTDIYLTKLDPTTGLPTALKVFGRNAGSSGTSRTPIGLAVASNGAIGLAGTFGGEIDFTAFDSLGTVTTDNPDGNTGTTGLDFVTTTQSYANFFVTLDATGSPVKGYTSNMSISGGVLLAITSNPTQSAFAVCGKTKQKVTGGLLTGTNTYGGGMDIFVAKIDATTGIVIWGEMFGGTGDQICSSIAMANNGDVVIAGGYNDTLQFGSLPPFPVVSNTTASLLYVATLASADGVPLAAATWGTSGKVTPSGLTVDAIGNIIVAGSLGTTISMGSLTLTDLGQTDAFVAKLDASLTPVWAKSFGDATYNQQAMSVTTTANGDILVSGQFIGSLGDLNLTSYSNTTTDAFVARLAAADGTVVPCSAHILGDGQGGQYCTAVAVEPATAGSQAGTVTLGGGFSSNIRFDSSNTSILDTGDPNKTASYILQLAQ